MIAAIAALAVFGLLILGSWLGDKLRKSGIAAMEDMKRQHEASILKDSTAAKLQIDIQTKKDVDSFKGMSKKELEDEINK